MRRDGKKMVRRCARTGRGRDREGRLYRIFTRGHPLPPHSNTNGIRKVSSYFFVHSVFGAPAHTSLLQSLSNLVAQNAYTRIKIDLNTLGQIMRLEDGRWMESNKPNRLSELIVARYAYDYGLRGTVFFSFAGANIIFLS